MRGWEPRGPRETLTPEIQSLGAAIFPVPRPNRSNRARSARIVHYQVRQGFVPVSDGDQISAFS